MATKNRLGVVVAAEDKVTGPMRSAAKAFVKAQKDVEKSDKKVTRSSKIKTIAINVGTKALKVAASAAKLAAAGIAILVAGAVIGAKKLFSMAKSSADLGDQAFIMADRLGVTSEFITQLGFAARQVGSSIGSAEKALKTLEKQALSGSITFKRWGIKVREANGAIKPAQKLFLDTAERIKGMTSEVEQSAAAQDIFGRAGLELLPLLRQGKQGFKEFADEADRLGVTISTADSIIANRFNNQLQALQDQLQASARVTGSVLLPVLTETFVAGQQLVIDFTRKVGQNKSGLEALARDGIVLTARAMTLTVKGVALWVQQMDNLIAAYRITKVAIGEVALASLDKIGGDLIPGVKELRSQIRQMTAEAADEAEASIKAGELRQKSIKGLGALIDTFADKIEAGIKLDIDATTTNTKNTDKKVKNILSETDAQKKLKAEKKDQARIDREAMAQLNRVNAAKKAARALTRKADEQTQENQKLAIEQQGEAETKRTEETGRRAQEAASFIFSNFETAFAGVFEGTKKMEQAFADLFKSIAVQLLKSGILKLLGGLFGAILGGPAGLVAGLGAGVTGLFTGGGGGPKGFQEGGELPGRPTPGRDSMLFAGEPGEVVLSRKAVGLFRRMLGSKSQAPGIQRFQGGGMIGGGGGGGIALSVHTHVSTPAPDQAAIVQITRDGTLQALKELQDSGQLQLALGGAVGGLL